MTDLTYYNDDPRYELMASIVNSPLIPDAETIRDDILEILKLCYVYTIDQKWDASDLANAIVSYLHGQWGAENFQAYAEEYWNPVTLKRDPEVTEQMLDIEN